ncbi:hypothetical protein LSAT2_008118 [Lamellibrachia satsuma]|nr:hypothetical protein LSAT2_008118 [Lamellibrachia satsuma]
MSDTCRSCWLCRVAALATIVLGQTCIPRSCREPQCVGYSKKTGPFYIITRKNHVSTQVMRDFTSNGGGWIIFLNRYTDALHFSAALHRWIGFTDDDFDHTVSDAGDSMGTTGLTFATPAYANDTQQLACAKTLDGGWWFKEADTTCVSSFLTGRYRLPGEDRRSCMHWFGATGTDCLKAVKMMVREAAQQVPPTRVSASQATAAGTANLVVRHLNYVCVQTLDIDRASPYWSFDERSRRVTCCRLLFNQTIGQLRIILPKFVASCSPSKKCLNGGTCSLEGKCKCNRRFTGLRCQVRCPCKNGGGCITTNTDYCECPQGTTGKQCETVLPKSNFEFIAGIVAGAIVFSMICVTVVVVIRSRRRRIQKEAEQAELERQRQKSKKKMPFDFNMSDYSESWWSMIDAAKLRRNLSHMFQTSQLSAFSNMSKLSLMDAASMMGPPGRSKSRSKTRSGDISR